MSQTEVEMEEAYLSAALHNKAMGWKERHDDKRQRRSSRWFYEHG